METESTDTGNTPVEELIVPLTDDERVELDQRFDEVRPVEAEPKEGD